MAASEYGLSIVLDFEDNATEGMQRAANTFSSLSGSVDNLSLGIGGTMNSLLDMNTSVVGMSVMGSQLQNMGEGVLGVFSNIGSKVMNTGSVFENFGLTLNALYKDEKAAARVTDDLFKYAKKSPYEVDDLTGLVITLKSQGVEAFEEIQSATSGARQEALSWIGDLQAFRPEATANQWKLAMQNFLSGVDNKSALRLRNILDIGDLSTFLGHDLGTNVQERFQSLTEIVDKLGLFGLQDKLSNTWSVVLSNMSDAWSQFTYKIGFGNVESNMYTSATGIMRNLLEVEEDLFGNKDIVNAVSKSFYDMISPVETLTELISGLSPKFSEWLGQRPNLIKFATGLTTVGGAALYASGTFLKMSSGVLNWMLNVQRLGGFTGILQMVSNALKAISLNLLGVGSVAGLVFLAWQNNVLGIKDLLTDFGGQAKGLIYGITTDLTKNNMTLKQSLNSRGLNEFTEGFEALNRVLKTTGSLLWSGFSSFFSLFGVNLPTYTKDTFSLKDALNDLGASLSERFGDLDTFEKKWGSIIKTLGSVGAAFMTALATSTLLGGSLKLLSGSTTLMLANFKMIGTTLMSPMGLLGIGLASLVAGYQHNFLGLHDTVAPIVDKLQGKIKKFKESVKADKDGNKKNDIFDALSHSAKSFWEWTQKGLGKVAYPKFDSIEEFNPLKFISIGEAIGQAIASGLLLFGNPLQKAIGLGLFAVNSNVGGIQDGLYSIVDDVLQVKDLLLEMSTGYGSKSQNLAEKFGLVPFAEGLVAIKDTAREFFEVFMRSFVVGNSIFAQLVKEMFPNMDFSLKGILNAFGTLGTKIKDSFDNGILKNVAEWLGKIASAATSTAGLFTILGGIASVMFKPLLSLLPTLATALLNPFTWVTMAMLAYVTNFADIQTKVNHFILAFKTDISGLADLWHGNIYQLQYPDRILNTDALKAFAEAIVNFKNLAKSLWEGFKSGVSGAVSEFDYLLDKILDMRNIRFATMFESIGKQILEWGGVEGTAEKLHSLGETIGNVATKAAILAPAFLSVSAASKLLGVNLTPASMGLNLIQSGFDLVVSGARTMGSSVTLGVSQAVNSLRNFSSSMSSFFRGLLTDDGIISRMIFGIGGTGSIGNLGANLANLGKNITNNFKNTFGKNISNIFQGMWNGTAIQKMFGGLSGLKTKLSNALTGFKLQWGIVFGTAQTKMSQFINNFKTQWHSAMTQVRSGFRWFLRPNVMQAFSRNVKAGFKGLWKSVTTLFSNMGSTVNDFFNLMSIKFKTFFENFATSFEASVKKFADNTKDFLFNSLKAVGDFLYQNAFSILGVVATIAGGIKLIQWQIHLSLVKAFSAMYAQMILGASKVVLGLGGITAGLGLLTAGILTFGTVAMSDWKELGEKIKEQKTFIDKVRVAYKWFREELEGTTERVNEFISGLDISKLASSFLDFIFNLGDSLVSILGGTTGTNGLTDVAGNLLVQITDGFANANIDHLFGIVEGIFNPLFDAIQTYAPQIGKNIGTVITRGIKFVGENSEQFFQATFTILKSLIDGLTAHPDLIYEGVDKFIKGLCTGIINNSDDIVSGIITLIDIVRQAIQDNSELLKTAAVSFFLPISDGIRGEVDAAKPLVSLAIQTFFTILGGEIAKGVADVLEVISWASATIGVFLAGIGTAIALLTSGAAGWNFIGAGAMLGIGGGAGIFAANKLDNWGDQLNAQRSVLVSQMEELNKLQLFSQNDLVIKVNSSGVQETVETVEELKELTNGEIVYKVRMNSDGSVDRIAGKIVEVKNADGSVSYMFVQINTEGEQIEETKQEIKAIEELDPTVQAKIEESGLKELNEGIEGVMGKSPLKLGVTTQLNDDAFSREVIEQKLELSKPIRVPVELVYDENGNYIEEEKKTLGQQIKERFTPKVGSQVSMGIDDLNSSLNSLNGQLGNLQNSFTLDTTSAVTNITNVSNELDKLQQKSKLSLSVDTLQNNVMGSLHNVTDKIDEVHKQMEEKIQNYDWNVPIKAMADSRIADGALTTVESVKTALSGLTTYALSPSNFPLKITGQARSISMLGQKGALDVIDEVKQSFSSLFSYVKSNMPLKITAKSDGVDKVVDGVISKLSELPSEKEIKVKVSYSESGKPSEIGKNASGTDYWKGGLTWVNEQGGELMNLPSGTQIIPHDESLDRRYDSGYEKGIQDSEKAMVNVAPNIVSVATSDSKSSGKTKTTSNDTYDYSVTFNKGSIVVHVDNAKGDTDYEAMAEKVWYYIERAQKRKAMARR